jgi:hypothetical protein
VSDGGDGAAIHLILDGRGRGAARALPFRFPHRDCGPPRACATTATTCAGARQRVPLLTIRRTLRNDYLGRTCAPPRNAGSVRTFRSFDESLCRHGPLLLNSLSGGKWSPTAEDRPTIAHARKRRTRHLRLAASLGRHRSIARRDPGRNRGPRPRRRSPRALTLLPQGRNASPSPRDRSPQARSRRDWARGRSLQPSNRSTCART